MFSWQNVTKLHFGTLCKMKDNFIIILYIDISYFIINKFLFYVGQCDIRAKIDNGYGDL